MKIKAKRKLKALTPKPHCIRFELFCPEAKEVFIAGSFNDWQINAQPLNKSGDYWVTESVLMPGRYEYRFIVDGQWMSDPKAADYAVNPFGALNSVLAVGDLEK